MRQLFNCTNGRHFDRLDRGDSSDNSLLPAQRAVIKVSLPKEIASRLLLITQANVG
jgi:hypothetical protein